MASARSLPLVLVMSFFWLDSYIQATISQLNLFIPVQETKKILGLDGELSYIRDGEERWNAIQSNLPIPFDVDKLVLTWQNALGPFQLKESQLVPVRPPQTVVYTINVSSGDPSFVPKPVLNITQTGNIPNKPTAFSIELKCSKDADADVPINMMLNITEFNETAKIHQSKVLHFKFIKLCRKAISVAEAESTKMEEEDESGKSGMDKTSVFYIAVGVACTTILIIATAVATLHVHSMPKSQESKSDTKDLISQSDSTSQQGVSSAPRIPHLTVAHTLQTEKQKKDVRLRLRDIAISRNLLTLGNVVQEGAFGRVYIGTLISSENGEEQRVFIKTVTDQASPDQVSLFLAESSLLKRTNHHNVLPIMHACLEEDQSPYVILPYMNRGNLKNYLRLSRTAEPLSKTLTTRHIVLMAIQIARGLQYLARRKIVHKDVACRNCVCDEDYNVKITDNALARDFFPGDYHCLGDNENRPVRWMACESLEYNKFTWASDVWSYGVLLWELTTLAQTPYANVDPFEMLRYLKSGFRLPQPSNCPDDLFTVMACCWALAEQERPQFGQVVLCLEGFYSTLNAFI